MTWAGEGRREKGEGGRALLGRKDLAHVDGGIGCIRDDSCACGRSKRPRCRNCVELTSLTALEDAKHGTLFVLVQEKKRIILIDRLRLQYCCLVTPCKNE